MHRPGHGSDRHRGPGGDDVSISQGNGNGDIATVDVTTVGGNVSITQGNGSSDIATVDATTVGGNVSITQGDGDGDIATVDHHVSSGATSTITQGNGSGDTATDRKTPRSRAVSVTITQGSGSGDTATVLDVTALNGNITISQSDVAGNAWRYSKRHRRHRRDRDPGPVRI